MPGSSDAVHSDHTAMMQQMLTGYELSQALFALAAADVPTVVDRAGRLSLDELAERTETNPDALARLVRSLVAHGVFRLNEGQVSLTGLGATLSTDHPRSLRGIAIGAKNLHYLPFSELEHTLRTGQPAATKYFGMPYFDWIAADPARASLFRDAMGTFMTTLRQGMLDGYRLPSGDVIADVGGGNGHVLAGLLTAPGAERRRGILLDRPETVESARLVLAAAGLTDRIDLIGGDFFQAVPAADIYLLGWVLHDWDDADARRILTSIARATRPGARLLIFESVMPDGDQPHPSKAMDVTMLAILGGRERTEEKYKALLDSAGFHLDRVVQTPSPYAVLEATLRSS
jgi:ubiquinone/menaquinone biosynthesis C-methylase UbiE